MKKRLIIFILLFTPLVFLLIYNQKIRTEFKTPQIKNSFIKPTPTCNQQLIKQKQVTLENIKKTDITITSLSAQIEDIKKWHPKKLP